MRCEYELARILEMGTRVMDYADYNEHYNGTPLLADALKQREGGELDGKVCPPRVHSQNRKDH